MSGEITVVGWEAANVIAQQLTKNGYQVKIQADLEVTNTNETRFMISFVHPVYEGGSFEIMNEEYEGLRTWFDIKKETGDELDHLNAEPVWSTRGDTDGDAVQKINDKVELTIQESRRKKVKRKK